MAVRSCVHLLYEAYNQDRLVRGYYPISIKTLAYQANIAPSSLYNFIENRTKRVDYETVEKIMEFFDVYDMNLVFVRTQGER